jgi:uncharacterized protein HemX
MSDPKHTGPHLVAVRDPSADSEPAAAPAGVEVGATGRGGWFWLLAAVAAVALVGLVVQTQRAGELAGRNEELAGELFTARTALDAYGQRFEEVRASVGGLQAEIEQLNALVSADPLAAAPAAEADPSGPAGVSEAPEGPPPTPVRAND